MRVIGLLLLSFRASQALAMGGGRTLEDRLITEGVARHVEAAQTVVAEKGAAAAEVVGEVLAEEITGHLAEKAGEKLGDKIIEGGGKVLGRAAGVAVGLVWPEKISEDQDIKPTPKAKPKAKSGSKNKKSAKSGRKKASKRPERAGTWAGERIDRPGETDLAREWVGRAA